MFAKRYSSDELLDIIAAQSYNPEIVSYVKKVDHHPKLKEYLKSKPKLGVTGTIAKDYVESTTPEAIPYITTKQVKGLHAYIEDAKFISKEADIEWKKCRVNDGDIVINKSGDVGAAAVLCCAPYKYANSVSDIISIKLSESAPINRDFLVVYLNSPYGQKQLQRLSGGAIFNHVSLHAIPDINVFSTSAVAQKYIGDKVRQAEQLRSAAKVIYSTVSNRFDLLIGKYDKENKFFERVGPELLADRLDQNHYKSALLNCLKLLQSKKHISLSDKKYFTGLTDGDHGNPKYGSGPIYLRASEMSNGLISIDSVARVDTEYAKNVSASCWAKPEDVIFSIVGTLGLTAIVDIQTAGLMSRGVAKVTSNIFPNYYLKAFFKTHYFQAQLERHSVGSVQRGVYLSALEKIIVPVFDEAVLTEISANEKLADDMLKTASMLTKSAKCLVEDLIECQISEAQLIAAEQALQAGNDELDRKILSRLKTDGFDGEEQALFADIDELYQLLAKAKEA